MLSIKAIETRYKGYRFRSKGSLPKAPQKQMSKRADRRGHVFGRLSVIEDLGVAPVGYRWWGCVCQCGERVAVRSRELDRGHTQSCGCLHRESLTSGGHNRLPVGEASFNELLASYIKSATSRGHEWALSREEFAAIVSGPCTYCGIAQNKERKPNRGVNGGFLYTGIDRVDNAIGYVNGNVVPCCWDCNRAKGTLSVSEFKGWITRLIKHGESGARHYA